MSNASVTEIMNTLKSGKGAEEEDSVQILGAGAAYDPDSVIRTGSITFDYATGRGGVQKGSLVHIYGPEASGKTTMALAAAGEIHREDPNIGVPYFDMENSLSPEWMETQGINLDSTPIIYSNHLEDFLNTARGLLTASHEGTIGKIPMMVLDSVAATHAKEVTESDAEDETSRAKEARLWAKHLDSITKLMRKTDTVFYFINQARENQNPYGGGQYVYPGGRALKHAEKLRILFKTTKALGEWEKGEKLMHGMEGAIEKNKTSGQLSKFIVRWYSSQRISRGHGLVDVWDQMVARDEGQKRRIGYDPETFAAATDNVPYAKGLKWDQKTDEPAKSANGWVIFYSDDILDAIRADEPDFDDKGQSGKSWANKGSFVKFIDAHPTLADLIEEYVLETLNLGLSEEEIEEIAHSEVADEDESDDADDVDSEEGYEDDSDEEEYDEEEYDEDEEEYEDEEDDEE